MCQERLKITVQSGQEQTRQNHVNVSVYGVFNTETFILACGKRWSFLHLLFCLHIYQRVAVYRGCIRLLSVSNI